MERIFLRVILFSSVVLVVSCTTSAVRIHSFPENAEVWVRPINNEKPTLAGVTPLVMTGKDLINKFDGQEAAVLELRKQGYKSAQIYVTDVNKVDITVTRHLNPAVDWQDAAILNSVVESLFEARRLTEAKKYEQALTLLSSLKPDFPNLAAIYEMEGGIYVLQGKYVAALDSYSKASDYNPENADLKESVRQLQKILGVAPRMRIEDLHRLPASEPANSDPANQKEGVSDGHNK